MAVDAHKNFAYSTIAGTTSANNADPGTGGTAITLQSGDGGTNLPTPPFNATVWPAGAQPTRANAEIVRVTVVAADVLTVTRTQEGSTNQNVLHNWQFAATITSKTLTDVETPLYTYIPYFPATSTAAFNVGSSTSAPLFLFPFQPQDPVAAGWVNLLYSMSWVTINAGSSMVQTWTNSLGLYTREAGAASTNLSRLFHTSFTISASIGSGSMSLSWPTSSGNTSYTWASSGSAGVNLSSLFTGLKVVQYGLNQTLSQGAYWLAAMNISNSAGQANGALSQSLVGFSEVPGVTGHAPMGMLSANFSTGTGVGYVGGGGNWMPLLGSYTVAGQNSLPAEITISQITQNANNMPMMQFWSSS